jgi:hypothetical protein
MAAAPALGLDYAKVARTLTREPAYKSKATKYALLLFGPQAKVRVWLVLDGDTVYLDRNGDGDLTDKEERFAKADNCKDVEIADPDGKTRYVITSVGVFRVDDPPREHLSVSVDVKGPVEYQQYCDVELRDSAAKAGLAHFHGPLTVGPRTINWKVPPQFAVKTGDEPTDMPAVVGTMDAEQGCWVVVRSHHGDKSAFPKGVCPVVDIQFPPKTPGAPAVRKRYSLDEFC